MRPKKILHRTELTSNRLYLNIPGGSRGFFYPPLKASVLRRKKIPKQSVSPWFLSFSTTFVRRNLSFPPRSFSTFCQTSRSKTPWARSNPTSIYVYPSSLRLDTRARSLFSILFRRIFFRRNRGNRFPSLPFPFLSFLSVRSTSLVLPLSSSFSPPIFFHLFSNEHRHLSRLTAVHSAHSAPTIPYSCSFLDFPEVEPCLKAGIVRSRFESSESKWWKFCSNNEIDYLSSLWAGIFDRLKFLGTVNGAGVSITTCKLEIRVWMIRLIRIRYKFSSMEKWIIK